MTETEITELFGERCAEFDAGCAGCYVWRAHDEYAVLVAAARQVMCARCRGTGALPDFEGETWSKTSSCPDCADLRALLAEVVRAGRTALETDGGDGGMTDLTRPLSIETLRQKGACEQSQERFHARWGDSVEVTEARCVSVADQFDWDWAARKLLSPAARAEYESVRAAALAEYNRVAAAAANEYRRAGVPALAEYERVRAAALAEYERVRAAAYESVRPCACASCAAGAEDNRVCVAARDESGSARAAAWARLYVSDQESPA